ncbi:MAG: hypothetical protein ABW277_25125 [Longimicrobiaceae bacterium]
MIESALVKKVEALLRERLDLSAQVLPPSLGSGGPDTGGDDARLRLVIDGKTRELHVQVKASLSSAHIDDLLGQDKRGRRGNPGWLLVTPELPPRVRSELRNRRINHVDLTGNVFIREPGLYVWLEADRKPPPKRLWEERSLNPFSKRASLVLRALLEHPMRAWGVRELAAEIRLSLGHASEVSHELVRRGYAQENADGISLGDGMAALRDWVDAYDWSKNQVTSFVVPFGYDELGPELKRALDAAGLRYALTMLAGADRIAPHVLHDQTHFYVPEEQAERAQEVIREALYGEAVPQGGTLHVMSPYYGDSVFYGAREADEMSIVSPIQLFIDLANYPLRGAEAARMLALGPLAHQLSLNRRQVKELTRIVE